MLTDIRCMNIGFSVSALVERFEHYAVNLKEIKHNPTLRNEQAFFLMDIEEIQKALTDGIKFPALFLQTPEVNKDAPYDSTIESFTFTWIILVHGRTALKSQLDNAKSISDKILKRLYSDVNEGVLDVSIDGTDEGKFGPIGDGLMGWAVSCTLSSAFDAEVAKDDWEDMR